MGLYDTVLVPCPNCGEEYGAQSKGGECNMDTFSLSGAPANVLDDVNRHAPFTCHKCGEIFEVEYKLEVVSTGKHAVQCYQCEMVFINGLACHETSCPNSNKVWDRDEQDWVEPVEGENVEES